MNKKRDQKKGKQTVMFVACTVVFALHVLLSSALCRSNLLFCFAVVIIGSLPVFFFLLPALCRCHFFFIFFYLYHYGVVVTFHFFCCC